MSRKLCSKKFKYRDLNVKINYRSYYYHSSDDRNGRPMITYNFDLSIYSRESKKLYEFHETLRKCHMKYKDKLTHWLKFDEDMGMYRNYANPLTKINSIITKTNRFKMEVSSLIYFFENYEERFSHSEYWKTMLFVEKTIKEVYEELIPNSIKFLED